MKIEDCSTYKKVVPASGRSITTYKEGDNILSFTMYTEAIVPHSLDDATIKETWHELTSTKALTLKSQHAAALSEKRVQDIKDMMLKEVDEAVSELKKEKLRQNRLETPMVEFGDIIKIINKVKERI